MFTPMKYQNTITTEKQQQVVLNHYRIETKWNYRYYFRECNGEGFIV